MSRAHRLTGALSILLLLAGIVVITGQAAAALSGSQEVGKLVVTYQPNPAVWTDVQPGDTLDWRLRVSLTGASAADLALQLSGRGPLLDQHLEISIEQCPLTPTDTVCGGAYVPVVTMPLAAAAGAQRWQLERLDLTQDVTLFVRLHVPVAAQVPGERTEVGIGLTATGDTPFQPGPEPTTSEPVLPANEPSSDPIPEPVDGPGEPVLTEPASPSSEPAPREQPVDDPLAYTGLDLLGPILLGLGLIGLGSLGWLSARQRRETS